MKALQEYSHGCAIGAAVVIAAIGVGWFVVWVYRGLQAMAAPL